MSDVIKQEIELRVREWKEQTDEAGQLMFQYSKAKDLADNTEDIIISKMKKIGVDSFTTYYGTVHNDDGKLRLGGKNDKPEKKTTKSTRKKDVLEA